MLDRIAGQPIRSTALDATSSRRRAAASIGRLSSRPFAWCAAGAAGWPAELDLVRRWYEPHLDRIHEDARLRQADLLQLAQIAAAYPSRERFLTELTLDPPDATSDHAGAPLLDEDYLILSTIHSAKGQEWKSVFVLNAVDGCLPSDLATGTSAEIEEERRLLYVAMTRAKDHLHLIVPQRFFAHGQRTTATATSMRRARASSRPSSSSISNVAPGRRPRGGLRHGSRRARRSISASACARAGARVRPLKRRPAAAAARWRSR